MNDVIPSSRYRIAAVIAALMLAVSALVVSTCSEPITGASFWRAHASIYDVTICRIDPNPAHALPGYEHFTINGTAYLITRPPFMISKEAQIGLLELMRDNHRNPSLVHSMCLIKPGIACFFRGRDGKEVGRGAICLDCSDWMFGGETSAARASFYDIHNRVLDIMQDLFPDDEAILAVKPRSKHQR